MGVLLGTQLPPEPALSCLALALGVVLAGIRRGAAARCAALLLYLSALGSAAWIENDDREGFLARAAAAGLPVDGTGLDLHFRGSLLQPAEPALEGDRVLRLRGRVEQSGEPSGPALTVQLRVRASPEAAMLELDALEATDEVRIWCRIRAPLPPRNPGSRDPGLRARGIDAVGSVKSARLIDLVQRGGPGPLRWAGMARRSARRQLDLLLGTGTPARALVGALLLGDRAALDTESILELRGSGLWHIVAISGVHVALLVWTAGEMLRRARTPAWGRFALLAPCLAGFSLMVGGRSSVHRAVLAAALVLFGRCIGREGDARNTLALLAAGLVVLEPGVLADPGFQLTFLATAGILLLTRPIAAALPLPRALGTAVGLGAAAHLATAPVVAWHFGLVAPVGLAAGWIAVPLCGAALLTGYGAILLGWVPPLGVALAWCTRESADALLALSDLCLALPHGALAVPAPSAGIVLAYYGLLFTPLALPPAARVSRSACAVLLGLAVAWVHLGPPPRRGSGRTDVAVLDVGQGLSVALRGPAGGSIVIDAGGSSSPGFDPGERIVVPFLLARWGARRVDALLVSHEHLDHAGGAFALLRELEVAELWLGPGHSRSPRLAALAALARSRGTAVVGAAAGTTRLLAGVPLRVLAPPRHESPRDVNSSSLVVLAGKAPARLLVPADIEGRSETQLLERGPPPRAEALVLAHHGSRGSSGAAFLAAVEPRWAIASAGRGNPFGHPHAEALGRVRASGARLLRTDRDGWVHLVESDSGWVAAVSRYHPRSEVP